MSSTDGLSASLWPDPQPGDRARRPQRRPVGTTPAPSVHPVGDHVVGARSLLLAAHAGACVPAGCAFLVHSRRLRRGSRRPGQCPLPALLRWRRPDSNRRPPACRAPPVVCEAGCGGSPSDRLCCCVQREQAGQQGVNRPGRVGRGCPGLCRLAVSTNRAPNPMATLLATSPWTGAPRGRGTAARWSHDGPSSPCGLEYETRSALEDAVVRYERDAEPDGRGGDPTVCVMFTLTEGVAGTLAGNTEFRVGTDEVGAGVHDLDPPERCFNAIEPGIAPSSEQRSVANLGHGLERHELGSPYEERFVLAGEHRVWEEPGAVDVGIDDDRAPPLRSAYRQLETASSKASPSSSVRSSMTCSPYGGWTTARRRRSSTGSSRFRACSGAGSRIDISEPSLRPAHPRRRVSDEPASVPTNTAMAVPTGQFPSSRPLNTPSTRLETTTARRQPAMACHPGLSRVAPRCPQDDHRS